MLVLFRLLINKTYLYTDFNARKKATLLSSSYFFLYGYVEGHMTLDDFSWTGPLSSPYHSSAWFWLMKAWIVL